MPSVQKTPFSYSLETYATRKASEALWKLGRALPCSVVSVIGSIVTVKFEVVGPYTLQPITIPVFGPEYIRYPIQVGDLGVTIPTDAYLGPTSGLGSGTCDIMMPQGNLSNLVFLPVGRSGVVPGNPPNPWSTVDPNAVTIYGPNGVVLRNTAATSTIIILPAGVAVMGENYVHLTCGACSIVMTPTTVTITDSTNHFTPATLAASYTSLINWLAAHTHSGVTAGSSSTGVPVSPPPSTNLAPAN